MNSSFRDIHKKGRNSYQSHVVDDALLLIHKANHTMFKRLIHTKVLPRKPIVDLAYTAVRPKSVIDENELNSRPVLITIHGIFGSRSMFRSFSRNLADALNFEVYNIDLRDHGESPQALPFDYRTMTKDVVHFIEKKFGTKRPIDMIGFSIGGRVALLTALCEKVNVNKCISIDLPPYTIPEVDNVLTENYELISKITTREIKIEKGTPDWKKNLMTLFQEVPANKIDKGDPALYFANGFLINKENDLPYNKDTDKDKYVNFYLPLEQVPDMIDVVKLWPDLYGKDNLDHFFKTSTNRSVLFMRALRSTFFKDDLSLVYKQFPNAIIKNFDTGHNMTFEKPKETMECIVEYFKE